MGKERWKQKEWATSGRTKRRKFWRQLLKFERKLLHQQCKVQIQIGYITGFDGMLFFHDLIQTDALLVVVIENVWVHFEHLLLLTTFISLKTR
jgi:hypothetical protein